MVKLPDKPSLEPVMLAVWSAILVAVIGLDLLVLVGLGVAAIVLWALQKTLSSGIPDEHVAETVVRAPVPLPSFPRRWEARQAWLRKLAGADLQVTSVFYG